MWRVCREKGLSSIFFSQSPEEKGFTLVELLIVIAIIVVIASLAVPVTLRARVQSNEAAAIGNLRTVGSSAESYRSTQNPPAYPTGFIAMITSSPPYLDTAWQNSQRQGYVFAYTPSQDGETYAVMAVPRSPNVSGVNSYCVDQTGIIRRYAQGGSGGAQGCDSSGTPI